MNLTLITLVAKMEFCNGYVSHLGFSHFAQGVFDLKFQICLGYYCLCVSTPNITIQKLYLPKWIITLLFFVHRGFVVNFAS